MAQPSATRAASRLRQGICRIVCCWAALVLSLASLRRAATVTWAPSFAAWPPLRGRQHCKVPRFAEETETKDTETKDTLKLDVAAVTSRVQRELGRVVRPVVDPVDEGETDYLAVSEDPEDEETRAERQKVRAELLTSLATAPTALSIVEVLVFADPEIITIEHAALAVRRIGLKRQSVKKVSWLGQDPFFTSFLQRVRTAVKRTSLSPGQIATFVNVIAHTRAYLPETQELLPEVIPLVVPDIIRIMNLQNLTNCLAAVAKLHLDAPEVVSAADPLFQEIVYRANSLDAAQASGTIWSAGELALASKQALSVPDVLLARRDPETFNNPQLANLLWGLAKLRWRNGMWLEEVVRTLRKRATHMDRKEIKKDMPLMLCALALLQYDDQELTETFATVLERSRERVLVKLGDWAICALAWTWPDERDDELFGDVRRVRHALNQQLKKRKLTPAQVQRGPMGPKLWSME